MKVEVRVFLDNRARVAICVREFQEHELSEIEERSEVGEGCEGMFCF